MSSKNKLHLSKKLNFFISKAPYLSSYHKRNIILEDKNILSKRKSDHIDMAFQSQMNSGLPDDRFYYEPLLGNPENVDLSLKFAGFNFGAPIWISSMTGGTEYAGKINENLARVANKFNLGLGLGSCRQLLDSDEFLGDFNVRKHIGERPLFANLGIAQIEKLLKNDQTQKIDELIKKIEANGLIVHVNPVQEFIQPEGDIIAEKPLETIKRLLDKTHLNIIVKEVGQGMGINSLKELMLLPLTAIEFGAYGGTNFTKLELLRNNDDWTKQHSSFVNIGHNADEMVDFVEAIKTDLKDKINCSSFIISGGVKNYIDGYYLTEKLSYPSLYGMASGFLEPAMKGYEELEKFVKKHIEGLKMAKAYLKIKK